MNRHLITRQRTKTVARWTGVALSILSVAFAVVSYTTHWDWWLRDDMVEKVTYRFDLSYAENAGLPVQRGDPEWAPVLKLIEEYSPRRGELPKDRPPMTVGRAQAITAAQTAAGEWTAPSTPIVLFYRKWPDPGSGPFKRDQDAFVVGTIGDLHDWIRRDRADFDFVWRTIFFGLLSACVGIALALADTTRPSTPAPPGP
jgi:hypothetical protein